MKHLVPWQLLPPSSDVCQECACKHEPAEPHNQQSLYYQYFFFGNNGRWPTWADAMSHCDDAVKTLWTAELLKHGVLVMDRLRGKNWTLKDFMRQAKKGIE